MDGARLIDEGIQAVFFDAVGTLLFPVPSVVQTYAEAAHRHGVDIPEDVVRGRLRDAFRRQEELDRAKGWRTDEPREEDRWRAIVGEVVGEPLAAPSFRDLWAWFSAPMAWRVHEEAGCVLAALERQGLVLGMASNFDGRLRPILDAIPELSSLRDRCIISSQIGWRKPAAEFFREVARVAGCPAPNILYVGDDRDNDYEGALTAGFQAVLLDPTGMAEDVRCITRLSDLLLVK